MVLSEYIKDLLYKHSCVIVPGFGAFVLNNKSATINSVSNSFTPPSKDVIFNSGINRNDGLLGDYLSLKMKISYQDALFLIRDSVEELKEKLNKGIEVKFSGIGYFKINDEGNTLFIQDENENLNLDSFGLSTYSSPAIKREGLSRRIEKKIEERKETKRDIRIPAYIKYAAASIIFISALVWTSYKTEVLHKINFNYSGIYNSLIPRIYNSELSSPVTLPKPSAPDVITKPDTIESKAADEVTAELTENNHIIPAESQENRTLQNISKHKYYIIAGCFSIEENATKLVELLKDKGFNALITGKTKTGLTRVAYGMYDNAEDASNQLFNIQTSVNPDAWLLRVQ